MKPNSIPKSLNDSGKALLSLLRSMYRLIPLLMIVFTLMVLYLSTLLVIKETVMVWILSFVIIISSISIYIKSRNYGESVLALAAGLLTVFSVTWTLPFFIGFIIVWVLFTVIVLFIISVRMASKIDSIFTDAAIRLADKEISHELVKKQLGKISNSLKDSILMPEERADIIRFFCFRKIPMDKMGIALKWVNVYHALTKLNYNDVASFVVEIMKNIELFDGKASVDYIFDYIYTGMRDTPTSPLEYMEGFKNTKYVLSTTKNTILYFHTLNKFFCSGLPLRKIENYLEENVVVK